jgi:hypothetical protein
LGSGSKASLKLTFVLPQTLSLTLIACSQLPYLSPNRTATRICQSTLQLLELIRFFLLQLCAALFPSLSLTGKAVSTLCMLFKFIALSL